MQISAKVDYGMRALLVLAAAYDGPESKLLTTEAMSTAQEIPLKFLEGILNELKHAGFVISQRGAVGGYRLSRSPKNIPMADVMRVLDGPLASVRGLRPEAVVYQGDAQNLKPVWLALRVSLRQIFENLTLDHVITGEYTDGVKALLTNPDANISRPIFATD